jgi:hypothetical protein
MQERNEYHLRGSNWVSGNDRLWRETDLTHRALQVCFLTQSGPRTVDIQRHARAAI